MNGPSSAEISPATRRAAIVMTSLSAVATAMMLSTVNVALPSIARALEINAMTLSWIPMAYLLASAACVLSLARLADMYGRRRVFVAGTFGVVLSSVMAACATGSAMLLCARVLQGASAAALFATQIAIISSVYPPERRGAAIGATISAVYIGLSLGPLTGGYVIDLWSWRAAFLTHLPLTVVVYYLAVRHMRFEWRAAERGRFDGVGAALYACGIVVLMLGLAALPSLRGGAMLVVGAVLLWLFFRYERRHADPIFDVELFYTNRIFTLSCLASLVMYTTTFANVLLVSLYLQYLKGVPATQAGMIMMTQPLVMALISPFAGRWSDRIEPRVIASLGMAITALGLLGLALLDAHSALHWTVTCLAICGLGFSLFSSPNVNAIMGAVPRSDYSRASGAMSVMRVVGQLTSMAMVAVVMALWLGPVAIEPAIYTRLAHAITTCFACGAALSAVGITLSLARGRVHGAAATS